ncbi:MAG: glycosyltransferase [Oscillospiraceae bacterium]|nr:glycosyltransferase [Oscillospiraceae bacterium]
MQSGIMVSIVCLAYNHEKYIRQTLDGFLSQKTEFAFEAIIHDDASTDNTSKVIREYAQRYPDIIKPVYQTENQYSKGTNIKREFICPLIKGRYVAICEGDDYWTDIYKLQRQIDAMEVHSECNMCVHRVSEVNEDGTPTGRSFPAGVVTEGAIPSKDFFEISKEYSFHTSSYIFRAEHYIEYIQNPPEFVIKCDVGDEPYMMYFGNLSDVFYIDDDMSCYRRGVAESWSFIQNTNVDRIVRHAHIMIDTYSSFDDFSGRKYHRAIVERISYQMVVSSILEKNAKQLLRKENREYFNVLTTTKKIYVVFSVFLPEMMRKIYLKRRTHMLLKRDS